MLHLFANTDILEVRNFSENTMPEKFNRSLLRTLTVAALALTWFAAAQPARAQTFICPTGPGPGERQVGMAGGGNGVAPMPVCVADGPPPPEMTYVPNYFAAAWHKDASDAWIVSGYSDEDRAWRAALLACNRVMGSGCTIAARGANGAVAIAMGVEGDLYASTEATRDKAEKDVMKYCQEQNDECVEVRWASATAAHVEVGTQVRDDPSYYGPKGDPHRLWGAIAWADAGPASTSPLASNVWVVGGRASRDKALADALALCQADLKTGCATRLVVSDVFLAVTNGDGILGGVASAGSPELAKKRALDQCRKSYKKCKVTQMLDLREGMARRFDPVAGDKR